MEGAALTVESSRYYPDSQVIYSAGGDCSDVPDNVCIRDEPNHCRIIRMYISQDQNHPPAFSIAEEEQG